MSKSSYLLDVTFCTPVTIFANHEGHSSENIVSEVKVIDCIKYDKHIPSGAGGGTGGGGGGGGAGGVTIAAAASATLVMRSRGIST